MRRRKEGGTYLEETATTATMIEALFAHNQGLALEKGRHGETAIAVYLTVWPDHGAGICVFAPRARNCVAAAEKLHEQTFQAISAGELCNGC